MIKNINDKVKKKVDQTLLQVIFNYAIDDKLGEIPT